MLAGEKNRLHKLLEGAGIKLGGVVADIDGVCASKMVEGLIAGGKPDELAVLGRGKVRATTDILEAAMDGELSARHRLVLDMAYDHCGEALARLAGATVARRMNLGPARGALSSALHDSVSSCHSAP
jgi:hypothetical protein